MPKRKTLVQDIMARDVVFATPDMSLLDAYKLMAEHDVRRLPVVREGLVGIVTLSDVLRVIPALMTEPDRETRLMLSTRSVREVMSRDPYTVYSDDTIQDAAERMLENRVSGLPVIEVGNVVGMVTESDLFRLVVESWSET